jgi:iron-sulfur cluster assembly accessory protein
MITLTDTAAQKIQDIMKAQGEPEASLRVLVTGMSCSGPQYMMTLENEKQADDTLIEASGLNILLDPDTAQVLEGSKIDYLEGLERSGFMISNPNFQTGGGGGCGGGCACGKQ